LREIKILQLLKHENVVNLIEICRTKGSLRGSLSHRLSFSVCPPWPLSRLVFCAGGGVL